MNSEKSAKSKDSTVYDFGEFRLEAENLLLSRNSKIVSLPPKTCEVLLALLQENGKLITKQNLMDTVWADTFVEEANLTHHISAIRKALGEDKDGRRFIETIPRRGYRFVAPVTENSSLEKPDSTADKIQETETLSPNPVKNTNLLIGRESEIEEIRRILCETETRILTLTGSGGTGKTRIAEAVADVIKGKFADGTVFVELASVVNPDLLVSTVANSLCIGGISGNPAEIVQSYFQEHDLLLILDNFEQILRAAPQLSAWLKSAPNLKILITSRVRVQIRGECEFAVAPLGLPADKHSFEEINRSAAVRLFVERATSAKSDFEFSETSAVKIAEICRRLDGLPLAIELAAARVRILSVNSILERLANQLKLLSGGSPQLPVRQQTMRAAIAWSYDLLEPNEKRLFEKLAIFSGSWTVEAAEAICADCEINILDGMVILLENNLLVRKENHKKSADHEPRFRMFESIAEFAGDLLLKRGERAQIERIHADYFLKFAETAEPELTKSRQSEWLMQLDEEHDNLRSAFSFYLRNQSENAARLGGAMYLYWSLRGHIAEGFLRLEDALQIESSAAIRAKALNGAGQLARLQGDYKAAQKFYAESLRDAEIAADRRQIAVTSQGLGVIAYQNDDVETARIHFERALPISRELGEAMITFSLISALGEVARIESDFAAARAFNLECETYTRKIGNQHQLCGSLINLGAIACLENEADLAFTYYAEAAQIAQELDIMSHLSLCLDGFSAIAALQNEYVKGVQIAGAAEILRQQIGYELETPDLNFRSAHIKILQSNLPQKMFADLTETGRTLATDEILLMVLSKTNLPQTTTEITIHERKSLRVIEESTLETEDYI